MCLYHEAGISHQSLEVENYNKVTICMYFEFEVFFFFNMGAKIKYLGALKK